MNLKCTQVSLRRKYRYTNLTQLNYLKCYLLAHQNAIFFLEKRQGCTMQSSTEKQSQSWVLFDTAGPPNQLCKNTALPTPLPWMTTEQWCPILVNLDCPWGFPSIQVFWMRHCIQPKDINIVLYRNEKGKLAEWLPQPRLGTTMFSWLNWRKKTGVFTSHMIEK